MSLEAHALDTPRGGASQTSDQEEAGRRSRRGSLLLSLAVVGFIASVAYADSKVDEISLGYLYILPIALSALVNRRAKTYFVIAVCIILHDYFGPAHRLPFRFAFNLLALIGFVTVALVVSRLQKEREALGEIIRRQRDELDAEINLASQVQQQLLPAGPPVRDGIKIAAGIKYAKKMGGDYYDFIELPDGGIGIAIADVSGKGTAAALLMPPVEVALRLSARNGTTLEQTFQDLNRVINDVTESTRFVTLFYGKLCLSDKRFEFINAGHNPPLRYKSRTETCEWLQAGGMPLGLFPSTQYLVQTIQLESEDILVFYTDGVTESENAAGEEFASGRVAEIVSRHAMETAQEIYNELRKWLFDFRGGDNFDDDLTLIVMKISAN